MNNGGDEEFQTSDGANYFNSQDQNEIVQDDQAVENEMPAFDPVHWSSVTTVSSKHSSGWNFGLFAIAVVVSGGMIALSIFNILSWFNSVSIIVLVVLGAVALLVVAKEPSHVAQYILTESGLTIDGQLHPFSEFRAFGLRKEGVLWQLVLLPVKRLGATHSMFIDADQGEKIVDIFGARFPMESISLHPIDKLSRLLKL
jgi:hypothetical protein